MMKKGGAGFIGFVEFIGFIGFAAEFEVFPAAVFSEIDGKVEKVPKRCCSIQQGGAEIGEGEADPALPGQEACRLP